MFAACLLVAALADGQGTVMLTLLDQKGKPKAAFWYGETIRFRVEFTAGEATALEISGSANPLHPVGQGLRFRRKDGQTFAVLLTPAWHHMPWQETVELTADRPSAREFQFPDTEAAGSQRSYRFAAGPAAKPDPAAATRQDYLDRWDKGTGLIPAGDYEVTFVTTAGRLRGGRREWVELKSPPVRLIVKGD